MASNSSNRNWWRHCIGKINDTGSGKADIDYCNDNDNCCYKEIIYDIDNDNDDRYHNNNNDNNNKNNNNDNNNNDNNKNDNNNNNNNNNND